MAESAHIMSRQILRHPLFIASIALVARLVAVLRHYAGSGQRLADIWNNGYEMAREAGMVASGAGFSSPFPVVSGPSAILPPGFPLLLATIFRVFGIRSLASAFVAVGMQIVISSAVCVIIFYAGKRVFGETAGAAGAWIWALCPSLAIIPGVYVWDTTLTALLASAGFLLAMHLDNAGWRASALFGALWGVAGLVNPSVLTVYGVLLLWSSWIRRRNSMCWAVRAALPVAIMAVLLAPWAVRNYRVFHRVIPVRDNFGMELWIGNHLNADGLLHTSIHPVGSMAEAEQFRRRGELGYIAWKQEQAVMFIRQHPAEFLRLTRYRVASFWGGLNQDQVVLDSMLLGTLGLLGLWLLARRDRTEMVRFALPLLVYPLPFYFTHPDLRFRYAIEPVLACLAGFAIISAVAAVRGLRSSQRSAEVEDQPGSAAQSAISPCLMRV
jgi:4-amino-4-deoxy-L-arabinose transferase-like glycosyltransferase